MKSSKNDIKLLCQSLYSEKLNKSIFGVGLTLYVIASFIGVSLSEMGISNNKVFQKKVSTILFTIIFYNFE